MHLWSSQTAMLILHIYHSVHGLKYHPAGAAVNTPSCQTALSPARRTAYPSRPLSLGNWDRFQAVTAGQIMTLRRSSPDDSASSVFPGDLTLAERSQPARTAAELHTLTWGGLREG